MKLELVDPYSSEAERIWKDLEAASKPAFFLSWAWISNWLACLPRGAHVPWLAVIVAAGAPLAACFLAKRLIVRSRVMPTRGLFFNTTGIERIDRLFIEYNGLVGADLPLSELLPLLPRGWDEMFLPALRADAFTDLEIMTDTRVLIDRVPVQHVDLAKVRAKDYLSLLSGQTRGQVRRAQREAGPLTVEFAADTATAIDIYRELTWLHTEQWRAKGKPGAFADPWFDRFHRRLITERFAHGEIQLVRVRNAQGPLGCLYNFVHGGRVLQYQSGFQTFENDKLKPGFVCHTVAIEHAAAAGHAVYDFLAGGQRYKKQLGTDESALVWARVQRRRLRFLVEDRMRAWRAARVTKPGDTTS